MNGTHRLASLTFSKPIMSFFLLLFQTLYNIYGWCGFKNAEFTPLATITLIFVLYFWKTNLNRLLTSFQKEKDMLSCAFTSNECTS